MNKLNLRRKTMFIDFKVLTETEKRLLKEGVEVCGYVPFMVPKKIPFDQGIPLDSIIPPC